MKISIDLDGTFFAYPKFLSATAKGLQKAGHKVGILTGRFTTTQKMDERRIKVHGFTPDFMINRPLDLKDDSPYPWKARMIRKNGIDVHYDDDAIQILKFMKKDTGILVIHVPDREPKE